MVELIPSQLFMILWLCRLISAVSFRCLKKKMPLLLTDDEPANERCRVLIVQDVLLQTEWKKNA